MDLQLRAGATMAALRDLRLADPLGTSEHLRAPETRRRIRPRLPPRPPGRPRRARCSRCCAPLTPYARRADRGFPPLPPLPARFLCTAPPAAPTLTFFPSNATTNACTSPAPAARSSAA